MLLPLDALLVIGGGGGTANIAALAGRHMHGRKFSGAIDQGHVVTHVHGDPRQRCGGIKGAAAGLEHVAYDQRHAEALAHVPPPAE